MDKYIVFFSVCFFSTLASAQGSSCRVYWGETNCSTTYNGIRYPSSTVTLSEKDATLSPTVILQTGVPDPSTGACEARYPKSKIVNSPIICGQTSINGQPVGIEFDDYGWLDSPSVSRNLYSSSLLHLKFGPTSLTAHKKRIEYKITSGAPGTGTNGSWRLLTTTGSNTADYDIDLAPLLNSSITGPIPEYPFIDFTGPWFPITSPHSIIRFRFRAEQAPWRYTTGVWLYHTSATQTRSSFHPSGYVPISSVIYGPQYGGTGGNEFEESCLRGSLSGMQVRSGSAVDAIKLNCYQNSGIVATQYGGNGGSLSVSNCPSTSPFVKGIQGRSGSRVDKLGLICTNTTKTTATSLPQYGGNGGSYFSYTCASGFSVKGLKGRADGRLDRISVICSNRLEDSQGE